VAAALFEAEGLRKSFGGVAALRDGRLRLMPGSVHALCGGNGAGKSTFLSLVMGLQERDGGTMRLEGQEVRFASPREALAAGISIITQELSPVPAMTVAENIFLGREPLRAFGRIDFPRMNRAAQELLGRLGFAIPPERVMMDLTVAQVQLVEIAKALSHDARVIIMDEPTSALGEHEADQLFAAVARLRAEGKGVIYVSHRLSEIFRISDSYTVFRDGAHVGSGAIGDVTREGLIQMIVGRPLAEEFVKANEPGQEVTLAVEGLSRERLLREVSFVARKGEILALYGLMGAGRTEILEAVFGLAEDVTAGEVAVEGGRSASARPRRRSATGSPSSPRTGRDRASSEPERAGQHRHGGPEGLSNGPAMSVRREKDAARRMIEMFGIRTASDQLEVSGLSGGNQQKVVLGKWFLNEPRILLLDEPTRGVDVGAKREIYRIMSDFARAGGTVVMVSSEIEEVLGMADRVVVIRDGRVSGELGRAEASAEALVHLAA
jgi:putative xylitol transport system ATP-binding protein